MRVAIFEICLIVYALKVEIDAQGSLFNRSRTSIAGEADKKEIEIILDAMRTDPQDPQSQRVYLELLLSHADNDDNARFISGAGGIALVLDALEAHAEEDIIVQRLGVRVLGNLAFSESARTSIGMLLIQRLKTCKESLLSSWWRILLHGLY